MLYPQTSVNVSTKALEKVRGFVFAAKMIKIITKLVIVHNYHEEGCQREERPKDVDDLR